MFTSQGDIRVATPTGSWTLSEGGGTPDKILLEIRNRKPKLLILDLTNSKRIDSSGMGNLVMLNNKAAGLDCRIELCALQKPVEDIIALARLDKVFTIHKSLAAALEANGAA